ncbi:tandem five-TM protein [Staphylococcus caeli]|uniref:Tandem five-TM protein n=1 Tax=Staphylococcus caeli TaxID=2201815 RepID=A0A1D4LJJ4_9STAP|nr:tandem five-TM protein [Staphylococcus caeli]SCS86526.1 tandem five-TM protein [Staphylococcus caeli]
MFPMINWFIPKTYEKLTKDEVDNLDLVIPNKDNSKALFASGIGVLISALLRPISATFDIHLGRMTSIIICVLIFLSIIFLHVHLYKKLTIKKYNFTQSNQKIILIPTFKNTVLLLFTYILFGFLSFGLIEVLIIANKSNILVFICWGMIFTIFSFLNMFSIIDTKVYAKLI